MTFGKRLRELREERGLKQHEIADILGVGRPTIAGYETKGKQADHDKLKMLADCFNVSIDYLLSRTDVKNPDDHEIETKSSCNLDVTGLPDEAIEEIEKYIELIKLKYKQDDSHEK